MLSECWTAVASSYSGSVRHVSAFVLKTKRSERGHSAIIGELVWWCFLVQGTGIQAVDKTQIGLTNYQTNENAMIVHFIVSL